MVKKYCFRQQGFLLPESKIMSNSTALEPVRDVNRNNSATKKMTQQILSQIQFITPQKAKGSKANGNNYVIVAAYVKDNLIRKSNRFEMSFKRFFESEKLDPQIADIALYKDNILVFFDSHTQKKENYHIVKPNNIITNRILVEKLFEHFQENLDQSEGAITRFYLRYKQKIGHAYEFEKAV